MKQYLDLLEHVLHHGVQRDDRTGTGTLSVFGHQMRFNLGHGFPVLTTKKLHLKSIIHELCGFQATPIAYLKENGVSIWANGPMRGQTGPGLRQAMAQLANAGRGAY